jgi:hypothetical protein
VWARGFRAGDSGVLGQAGANLIKEFAPDVKRLFSKK